MADALLTGVRAQAHLRAINVSVVSYSSGYHYRSVFTYVLNYAHAHIYLSHVAERDASIAAATCHRAFRSSLVASRRRAQTISLPLLGIRPVFRGIVITTSRISS